MDTIIQHDEMHSDYQRRGAGWKSVLYVVALGRVGVGGAGAAIALLGVFNLVSYIFFRQWALVDDDRLFVVAGFGAIAAGLSAAITWHSRNRRKSDRIVSLHLNSE